MWCDRSWECDCCRTYKLTIGQLKRKCIIKEWPKAIGDEHRSVFDSWQKTSLFMPNDWKVEEIDFPRYALRLITSVLTDWTPKAFSPRLREVYFYRMSPSSVIYQYWPLWILEIRDARKKRSAKTWCKRGRDIVNYFEKVRPWILAFQVNSWFAITYSLRYCKRNWDNYNERYLSILWKHTLSLKQTLG